MNGKTETMLRDHVQQRGAIDVNAALLQDLHAKAKNWRESPGAFMASATPDVMLALIDRLERADEAMAYTLRVIESAGVLNLASGVQLGQMSWLCKCDNAVAMLREAILEKEES